MAKLFWPQLRMTIQLIIVALGILGANPFLHAHPAPAMLDELVDAKSLFPEGPPPQSSIDVGTVKTDVSHCR